MATSSVDIAYARRVLSCLALELPETVHAEASKVLGAALDELVRVRSENERLAGVVSGLEASQAELRKQLVRMEGS